MEVRCYLKAKTEGNMKNPFINKNLPAPFCLLLLMGQFDKAGVIPFFIHTPLREDFLEFHTPRNYTSTCSSDIQILCDFRGIFVAEPLEFVFFVDFSLSLLSYAGCLKKVSDF